MNTERRGACIHEEICKFHFSTLANMPSRDAKTLHAAFLVENVTLAYEAWREAAWGGTLPKEIFLNNILPYINMNEKRDVWRADFRARFLKEAQSAGSMAAVVRRLNGEVFRVFNVSYHPTKREKPDQSPYESIAIGFASCTGLSIMISDALRAVGIPTRLAGTALWHDGSGNHTWVDVWDGGVWHHIEAADTGDYDVAWFNEKAAKAEASDRLKAIYATSFRKTALTFPLVWDEKIDYVYAENVTASYASGAVE